jgi:hypothetical protein
MFDPTIYDPTVYETPAEASVMDLCSTTVASLMPAQTVQSLMPVRSVRSLMPERRTVVYCEHEE